MKALFVIIKIPFILLVFKHKDAGSYFAFFIELALARSLRTCSLFPPNLYCSKEKASRSALGRVLVCQHFFQFTFIAAEPFLEPSLNLHLLL